MVRMLVVVRLTSVRGEFTTCGSFGFAHQILFKILQNISPGL